MRAGDQFEVNFHNTALPHNVVLNVSHKPHAAIVTPTVQRAKGYKRCMSSQECVRLQYGKNLNISHQVLMLVRKLAELQVRVNQFVMRTFL